MAKGGARKGAGNPGYGKMEQIRINVDKFSPLFWQLMEKFASSKKRDDQKFFIQEFNKIQVKMIPQAIDGDGEGGAITVKVLNYGDNPTSQIPAERLPTSDTPSD